MALPIITDARSRAITYENRNGEPGKGGMERGGRKGSPSYNDMPAGSKFVMMDVDGPGMIKHIWITIRRRDVEQMRNVILRMWWDHEPTPSVEAPFLDFFGQSHGLPQPLYSALVTATEGRGFNCYFAMPFSKHAKIELDNQTTDVIQRVFYQIDYDLLNAVPREWGRFHVQWRRQNPTIQMQDYVLLDNVTKPGVYVGTVVGIHAHRPGWWGEGEFKFYIEGDDKYPTICGTGTEDYFCSAWGLGTYQSLYHGCTLNEENWFSLYRWHVTDPIRFKQLQKVTCQQMGWGGGGLYERSDDWCSTAYWYQIEPHNSFPPLPDKKARMADLRAKALKKESAGM
jgi:hypothetical protein